MEYPHCDQKTLHAPGECEYCDAHSDWQELRKSWGVPYSETPKPVVPAGEKHVLGAVKVVKQTFCPRRGEIGGGGVFNLPESDGWREDNTCTYCGSLHPDEFMKRAEAGEELIPTDKNYKIYMAAQNGKFYFQHLSVEQQKKFVELYNAKVIKLGYPGNLYTSPFFMARVKKAE